LISRVIATTKRLAEDPKRPTLRRMTPRPENVEARLRYARKLI
jgi:hypothetical protein